LNNITVNDNKVPVGIEFHEKITPYSEKYEPEVAKED